MSFASTRVRLQRHADLGSLRRHLPRIAERALLAGAAVVEGHAKLNIETHGLVDTGNLLGSPSVYGPRREGDTVLVGVGTPVEYGKYHELGTQRLPARPWLAPAVFDHKAEFEQVAAASARRDIARLS